MEEALLLLLIRAACEAFAHEAYRQMLEDDLPVGGDTDVSYTAYLVADGIGAYYDEQGNYSEDSLTFTISDSSFSEGNFFITGSHVKWFISGEGASAGDVDVTYFSGNEYFLSLQVSDGFSFSCLVDGKGANALQTDCSNGCRIDSNTSGWCVYTGGDSPTYSTNWTQQIMRLTDVTSTSVQTVHDTFPDAVYVPAPTTNVFNYNDYRQAVINWANTTYNFNLTIEDAPEWEDVYPTEESTEEPVQPFTLDYNEILSEDELESILTQESYEVSEIESITETIVIDIEDLVVEGDTEYKEIMGFVPDAMAVSMDLLNSLGVSAPLTSAAIISCIWKIIKGR